MTSQLSEKDRYLRAQRILKRRRIFIIHLAGYIVAVALIALNFYVLEEGPYKGTITALNLSIVGVWTVFIIIHGIDVYRKRSPHKKTWEDKKTEELLKKTEEHETQLWE